MGASTALKAAATDPRIAALVLEAPYLDLASAVAAVLRRLRIPGLLARAGPPPGPDAWPGSRSTARGRSTSPRRSTRPP